MSTNRFPDDFLWIIYVRISDDREGGGLGVKRQEEDGLALVARLGGRVLTVCVDNDLTANDKSRRWKPRPEYKRMCEIVAEHRNGCGIVAWHADRLHRSPRELEDFIDLIESTKTAVETVKAGTLDLSTPAGRMVARQLGAVARYESEHKSDRIRRKTLELAEAGKIHGGGPRPFGYHRVYAGTGPRRSILRDELHPEEAPLVRECARRALNGQSLWSIANWLNEQGVRSSTGRHWSQGSLRNTLRSGRIAGLRERDRVVVAKAVWPAIISVEDHKLLRALFDSPGRLKGRRARIHYLTGFVYCSSCISRGVKMRVAIAHGQLRYGCIPKQEGGCNGRAINLDSLVKMVDIYMVELLKDPQQVADLLSRESDSAGEIAALVDRITSDERRLGMLASSLEDGEEDALPEVLSSMRKIKARIGSTRERLANLSSSPDAARVDYVDMSRRWNVLDIDMKQSMLRLFVDSIVILPGVRGRSHFDPDRVVINPR